MGNLTKEASRLKYQYNKKYMDAYWNRKAEKLKEEKRKEEEDDREEIRTAWKSHATLTLLAKQDCPLWLQYD